MKWTIGKLLALVCAAGTAMAAQAAPDGPRFAGLGGMSVGVRQLTLTHPAQPDLFEYARSGGKQFATDRALTVHVWHPAKAGGVPVRYQAALPAIGKKASGQTFSISGNAVTDAEPLAGKRYPLVLISHGFGGWGTFMAYLAEGLASRGYVVAAIDHADQPFTDGAGFGLSFGSVMLHRSRDQQFVLRSLRQRAADAQDPLGRLIDPERVGLIGYSMGGFGALATAGAAYDRNSPSFAAMPPALAQAIAAPRAADAPKVDALVLLAPWGAQPAQRAWTAEALARIDAPSLLISGDQDDIVDYANGVQWLFKQMKGSQRHLLVYQNARHNIGGHGAPVEAGSFEAREYFEEPVWRKDRLMAINQHFIAAFLDRHLKKDSSMNPYLDLKPARSNEATWPLPFGSSSGAAHADGNGASATYWPGFQRRWAVGLEMHTLNAGQ